MKRKIAIAMASIMAVSPLTVFAASYNYRSRTVENAPEKTMLLEQSIYNQGLVNLEKKITNVDATKNSDVKYMASGTDLVIELRDKVAIGDTFQVTLTNGEWDFQNISLVNSKFQDSMVSGSGLDRSTTNGALDSAWVSALKTATGGSGYSGDRNDKPANVLAFGSNYIGLDRTGAAFTSNYDIYNGIYDGDRTYYRYPAGTGLGTTIAADTGDLAYELKVSAGDSSVATVTIKQTPKDKYNDKIIRIPLVLRTKGSGEVKATIDARSTTLSSGTVTIASLGGSSISASIKDQVFSKYTFLLEKVKLTEKYTGTFKGDGPTVVLEAPYGYYWANPKESVRKDSNGNPEYPQVYFEGMKWQNTDTIDTQVSKVLAWGTNSRGETDKKKLVLDLSGGTFSQSSTIPGSIYFDLIALTAEDYASYDQDIKLTVKKAGTTDFDDVTFVIGQRKDWGITLTNVDDYTKFVLVNGRYAFAGSRRVLGANGQYYYEDGVKVLDYGNWDNFKSDIDDNFDDNHETATIKVEENVTNSWWAGRETTFTLTEGVKFIRVNIDNSDNFNTGIEGDYISHKGRDAFSAMDANKLTLFNLEVKKDKKAKFEITSWVSVQPGVEGDLSMYVNAVTDADKTVVPSAKIAKAVSPVTLTTETRDVKIGYQFQKVADFTITETAPRMLQRDREVVISIDDEISGSDSIYIAPDFVVETNGTDSKIDFSKPVVSGGQIKFTIERESDQKPATIKFSNVYVKVDRTVPESNNRPYKVVLSGTAIAANYYGLNGQNSTSNYEPTFGVKGIGANYINVVTSANDKDSILSNVVKVTIGSDKVLVGRNNPIQTQMDTAAYISTAGATMVPVRFVSQALGIPENQVKWDNENRTVTIMTTNKTIQFKIGSSDMTVNGATYKIYNADNTVPVNAEIKDSRAFLPFRALGDALGVDVYWDEATKSAIYNYSQMINSNTQDAVPTAVTE